MYRKKFKVQQTHVYSSYSFNFVAEIDQFTLILNPQVCGSAERKFVTLHVTRGPYIYIYIDNK